MRGMVEVNGISLYLEECCACKTQFAMSIDVYRVAHQRKESGGFCCPNGHAQHYTAVKSRESILEERIYALARHAASLKRFKEAVESKRSKAREYQRKYQRQRNVKGAQPVKAAPPVRLSVSDGMSVDCITTHSEPAQQQTGGAK